jgi:hypothetical protein
MTPQAGMAQTTKQLFASQISLYEAGVKRNHTTAAQQSFNSAMTMIADEIAAVTTQIQNTTNPTVLATLNAQKNAMMQIQADIQVLQGNIFTNYNTIKMKLDDFKALIV